MSSWGDRFVSEIEKFKVPEDKLSIWFAGGDSIIMKVEDEIIYIDPFFGMPPSSARDLEGFPILRMIPIPIEPTKIKNADLVLITHDHFDHFHKETLSPIYLNTKAIFLGSSSVVNKMKSWGFEQKRLREIRPEDEIKFRNINISAFNSNDEILKDAVMYTMQFSGITILHSGDSRYFDGFLKIGKKHDIDVAFLSTANNPPGRQMYLTPYDVLRAATDLNLKILIPIHWDLWKRSYMDPFLLDFMAKNFFPKIRISILRLGDSIVL